MIIKYAAGSGAALLVMILLMVLKYNYKNTKSQNKKNDIKLKNDDEFYTYGQFVVIDQ